MSMSEISNISSLNNGPITELVQEELRLRARTQTNLPNMENGFVGSAQSPMKFFTLVRGITFNFSSSGWNSPAYEITNGLMNRISEVDKIYSEKYCLQLVNVFESYQKALDYGC